MIVPVTQSDHATSRSRRPMHRPLLNLLLGGTIAFHALILFGSWPELAKGDSDFVAFFSAGRCLRLGLGSDLYDQQTLARLQNEFAPELVKTMHGPLPYTHPPFESVLFAPLAALPYATAFAAWDIISILALATAVLLLRVSLQNLRFWSGSVPLLCSFAFFPVFWCLFQGQDSTLLLLLFVAAYISLKERHDILAGFFLGLALVKFQYVVPLMAIFLLRRKWNVLAGFAATAAALTVLSATIVGWAETLRYPHTLLLISQAQSGLAMRAITMPNLRGAIESLLGSGMLANWILGLASGILVVVVARRCMLEPEQPSFNLEFSLAVTVATIVSYHVQPQDLTLLLLPLLLVSEELFKNSNTGLGRRLLLPTVVLAFVSPLFVLLPLGRMLALGHTLGHTYTMVLFILEVSLAIGSTLMLSQSQPYSHARSATHP